MANTVVFYLPLLSLLRGAAALQAGNSTYDLPLTWTPYGFTAPITAGNPPQHLDILQDWTWASAYMWTPTCFHQVDSHAQCLNANQMVFNQTLSDSFEYVPDNYTGRTWNPNHFFGDNPATVDYATDVLTIGPVADEIVLQASDFTFDLKEFAYPFAGIYGLAPALPETNASDWSPFVQSLKKGSWREPFLAFHYCYPGSPDTSKSSCNGYDAIQTHGAINDSLVKGGEIVWYENRLFPDVNSLDFIFNPPVYNYWGIEVESVSVGGEAQVLTATPNNTGPAAIFDHAAGGRGLPLSETMYDTLLSLADAKPITLEDPPNNGKQAFYQVDCASVSTLPDISYKFTGSSKEWKVEPRNYVENIDESTCVLNVRVVGSGNMFLGNFGETFAKDKLIVFDFEKVLVGIADVQWP
ncbi:eukaryotic aspartyl protease [Astrocystis sublimbata]|nr:eukaryotic aspartyl protease [Astrocystis sublimbata]